MINENAGKTIQGKLSMARQLLIEAGNLAEEEGIEGIEFMGLRFEPSFGWFLGRDLQEASEWNSSWCTIGSRLANEDWKPSIDC